MKCVQLNTTGQEVALPSLLMQGCHSQGKVREKSGSFVLGQGIFKSLFKVSEKSGNFILRLPQIISLHVVVFSYRQGNFVLKII